jgi:trans-2,3-dihydro-3-hydroxyanthranilate isomerase
VKELNYYILDVFSQKKYKGNPLSVVWLDGDLELSQLKDIAREFGYAETSFVQYSSNEKALKVRSFTPSGFEVSGAGHNLLGAVCLVFLKGWNIFREQGGEQFVIMKDKNIPIVIRYDQTNQPFVEMKQQPAAIVRKIPAEIICNAVGLDPEVISIKDWEPAVVKTEVAHLMVPVKDNNALNLATINKPLLNKVAEKFGFQGCYLFTIDPIERDYVAETRFFNPGIGIDEDAATGSAAGPLAGYLLHHGYIQTGNNYTILQGVQMQQPSTIHVKVTTEGIWVSGTSVIVMEGKLYL